MTHLGSLTSALVDGQLDPAAAERALAHAAACAPCAAELAAARASQHVLSAIDDVAPAPDLTARLLALGAGGCGPGAPDGSGTTSGPRRPTVSLLAPTQPFPSGGMRGDVAGRHGARRWVASSAVGIGAAALALFVIGDAHVVAPSERPAQAMALLAHVEDAAGTASVVSRDAGASAASAVDGLNLDGGQGAVLAWMHANGWPCPEELPTGATVTAVRLTADEVLEVDVETPRGQLVLTEQRGILDTSTMAGADRVDVGGASAYVLSRSPWHLAWQSQDTVVELVSDAGRDQVQQVARTIPAEAFSDAPPARIVRGWQIVTGAVAGP